MNTIYRIVGSRSIQRLQEVPRKFADRCGGVILKQLGAVAVDQNPGVRNRLWGKIPEPHCATPTRLPWPKRMPRKPRDSNNTEAISNLHSSIKDRKKLGPRGKYLPNRWLLGKIHWCQTVKVFIDYDSQRICDESHLMETDNPVNYRWSESTGQVILILLILHSNCWAQMCYPIVSRLLSIEGYLFLE